MNENEFHSGLQRLIQLDPANALLSKFKREGNTLVNALLLTKQVEKAEMEPPTEQFEVGLSPLEGGKGGELDPTDDDTLRQMRVRLRKLFTERNKLSDRLYPAQTVTERANISDDIKIVQTNIRRTMQAIRHYKLHGELPEDAMKHYLPKDGLALKKKQLSLGVCRSRKKKEIKELRESLSKSPNDPTLARKLEKAIDKLNEYETNLKNVKEAIENIQQ